MKKILLTTAIAGLLLSAPAFAQNNQATTPNMNTPAATSGQNTQAAPTGDRRDQAGTNQRTERRGFRSERGEHREGFRERVRNRYHSWRHRHHHRRWFRHHRDDR